ncbi:MAG: glycosyltransferase [Actinomycetota bacterium]|nr:glycosyltransferase [Actinomycetota bacterium]
MRILLATERYDYGRPELGDSYPVQSFLGPLRRLGHDVALFDTFDPRFEGDPSVVGEALLAEARSTHPDLVLFMLHGHEVPTATLDRLRQLCATVNWFTDDSWRFRSYSSGLAGHFDAVLTTCRRAHRAYGRMAGVRALFCPWGFDSEVFHPVKVEPVVDVLFVGQRYGRRGAVVDHLRRSGLVVRAIGRGWQDSKVTPEELAPLVASARVHLSFLDSSAGPLRRSGINLSGTWRADQMLGRLVPPQRQMKARVFEVAGAGGFQLAPLVPEVDECLKMGRELDLMGPVRSLARRIRSLLADDAHRSTIATAGYQRAVAEHTYERRFTQVFVDLGLP